MTFAAHPVSPPAVPPEPAAGEARPPRARPLGWWGMVLFIGTELALFGALLSSYAYLWSSNAGNWPMGDIEKPELRLVIPGTVVLLASSLPMIWAESAIKAGRQWALRIALLGSMALGVAFLGIQGWEYAHSTFGPGTNAYGSLFFTITSAHGLHLLAGILIVAFVEARAFAGHFSEQSHEAVSNVALYWHFVDLVWLAVFATLYLGPRFA